MIIKVTVLLNLLQIVIKQTLPIWKIKHDMKNDSTQSAPISIESSSNFENENGSW